jgi:3D (Asp-Asp-Asp) domain-containing protein
MTTVPSPALAYAQQLSTSQGPLVFVRDEALADRALMSEDVAGTRYVRASTLRAVVSHDLEEGESVRVWAFAYSSSVNQTDATPYTTANGSQVASGTMAANWLPFGSQVRIGDTVYTVQDRMNERYNDKYVVDVWQGSHEAAIAWGVRVVEVEIVSLP